MTRIPQLTAVALFAAAVGIVLWCGPKQPRVMPQPAAAQTLNPHMPDVPLPGWDLLQSIDRRVAHQGRNFMKTKLLFAFCLFPSLAFAQVGIDPVARALAAGAIQKNALPGVGLWLRGDCTDQQHYCFQYGYDIMGAIKSGVILNAGLLN